MSRTTTSLVVFAVLTASHGASAAGFSPWSERRVADPVTVDARSGSFAAHTVGFAPWVERGGTTTRAMEFAASEAVRHGFAPWMKPGV